MKLLDLRTLPCPEPVIQCRKALSEKDCLQLQIIVDNDAAVENVSRYLEKQGYTLEVKSKDSDFFIFAAKGHANMPNEVPVKNVNPEDKSILVLITTDKLGRGDDNLGDKLMTTFINTLSELGPSLWRVVLLNGGVKLAALSCETAETLKKLEKTGVSILVCGTCLNHYGLAKQKQVGETSNMLDIITSLQVADKIIRP